MKRIQTAKAAHSLLTY